VLRPIGYVKHNYSDEEVKNNWRGVEGVQLSYKFIWLDVIASSLFPFIASWVCIRLGGVQGHPRDPTS
jgi:hypothetical protein